MRFSPRTVLTALAAVFALSAVAVSSASAAPEWYVKKGGVWSKVTTSVKATSSNTLEVIDTKILTVEGLKALAISCEGNGEGVVEAAGKGKITNLGTVSCKPGKAEHNLCKTAEKFEPVHLPWTTELYKEGTTVRSKIGGASTPEIDLKCSGYASPDLCQSTTSTLMSNNLSSGLVEASFDKVSNKVTCSISHEQFKEALGEWQGTMKVKPTTAEKEKGVEALKVE
jgi:hypothetical protein